MVFSKRYDDWKLDNGEDKYSCDKCEKNMDENEEFFEHGRGAMKIQVCEDCNEEIKTEGGSYYE